MSLSAVCYDIFCFVTVGKLASLILRAVICCVLLNALYFIIYMKSPEFRQSVQLIDKMTKGKLKLERLL